MPRILTEITEIVTGLGMTGIGDLATALATRPRELQNVRPCHWDRIEGAFATGEHAAAFEAAWANGRSFLESPQGLRGRAPLLIEWKGPHHQPGYDALPADLRVDHVYLVSCKYQSKILANSSPANLFLRRLADRTERADSSSWYASSAPEEFHHFYSCVRRFVGLEMLPARHQELTAAQIARIRDTCGRAWPRALLPVWRELSGTVAVRSADLWRQQMTTDARKEEMLWRLLRLGAAPYFVLGSSPEGPLQLRIGTPWDWRQSFCLKELCVKGVPAGQPRVTWTATLGDRATCIDREVTGHVEVRWAHGRFSTVEAKIYLDTPHADVPGYFQLTDEA